LGELLHQELEMHEIYLQANQGKNEQKQLIGEPLPPFMVRKLNLMPPKYNDLVMVDQDSFYTTLVSGIAMLLESLILIL